MDSGIEPALSSASHVRHVGHKLPYRKGLEVTETEPHGWSIKPK